MAAERSGFRFVNVACPFCGLACDDLAIAVEPGGVRVHANGCHISERSYAWAAFDPDYPAIAGERAALAEAAAHAASILQAARAPLIAGLGTDVAGMRAALRLAERLGATLDHMHGEALRRNTRVLQDAGSMTTTLSEVRNRADLVLFVGVDVRRHFPRFFERVLPAAPTLFADTPLARELVFLGEEGAAPPAPEGYPVTSIACRREVLGEVVNALRALVRGRTLQARRVADVAVEDLRRLAERLRAARYGVIAWAAGQLDFPHAELALEAIADLVKALNRATRCSGLPLGGRDGDLTANQVALWQTGWPLPLSFARGYPEHDPGRFSAAGLLARGEADALLWLSAFDAEHAPPQASVPTVVLARAGAVLPSPPEVYIPLATPGLDHAGQVFRCDGVVALPLPALRPPEQPSAAQALDAIQSQLRPARSRPC